MDVLNNSCNQTQTLWTNSLVAQSEHKKKEKKGIVLPIQSKMKKRHNGHNVFFAQQLSDPPGMHVVSTPTLGDGNVCLLQV